MVIAGGMSVAMYWKQCGEVMSISSSGEGAASSIVPLATRQH
jgi:hypothetical protein